MLHNEFLFTIYKYCVILCGVVVCSFIHRKYNLSFMFHNPLFIIHYQRGASLLAISEFGLSAFNAYFT